MSDELTIIVPVFNEEESLPAFFAEMDSFIKTSPIPSQVLFINDGSTDNSLTMLREKCRQTTYCQVLSLKKNSGLSVAIKAGFDHCATTLVGYIDADLQTHPADFLTYFRYFPEYDMVNGIREKRQDSLTKRTILKAGKQLSALDDQRCHNGHMLSFKNNEDLVCPGNTILYWNASLSSGTCSIAGRQGATGSHLALAPLCRDQQIPSLQPTRRAFFRHSGFSLDAQPLYPLPVGGSGYMNHYIVFSIGFLAQTLFSARQLTQWIASEKAGRSLSPLLFWQLSILASFLLMVYGILRNDLVIILGQVITYGVYIRNLHYHGFWVKVPAPVRILAFVFPGLAVCWLLSGETYNIHASSRIALSISPRKKSVSFGRRFAS